MAAPRERAVPRDEALQRLLEALDHLVLVLHASPLLPGERMSKLLDMLLQRIEHIDLLDGERRDAAGVGEHPASSSDPLIVSLTSITPSTSGAATMSTSPRLCSGIASGLS
jgi:hypothetical protein